MLQQTSSIRSLLQIHTQVFLLYQTLIVTMSATSNFNQQPVKQFIVMENGTIIPDYQSTITKIMDTVHHKKKESGTYIINNIDYGSKDEYIKYLQNQICDLKLVIKQLKNENEEQEDVFIEKEADYIIEKEENENKLNEKNGEINHLKTIISSFQHNQSHSLYYDKYQKQKAFKRKKFHIITKYNGYSEQFQNECNKDEDEIEFCVKVKTIEEIQDKNDREKLHLLTDEITEAFERMDIWNGSMKYKAHQEYKIFRYYRNAVVHHHEKIYFTLTTLRHCYNRWRRLMGPSF